MNKMNCPYMLCMEMFIIYQAEHLESVVNIWLLNRVFVLFCFVLKAHNINAPQLVCIVESLSRVNQRG